MSALIPRFVKLVVPGGWVVPKLPSELIATTTRLRRVKGGERNAAESEWLSAREGPDFWWCVSIENRSRNPLNSMLFI